MVRHCHYWFTVVQDALAAVRKWVVCVASSIICNAVRFKEVQLRSPQITGIYQPNGAYKEAEKHPFAYHYEDIKPGMSLETHKRTLTDSDIQSFANLTWDHFYAHTDITSLEGSIFKKRTAHGYFIISAAAGLFVYPNKGPVSANYGLEDIRFLRPLYHNDTIYVRLTCKEKRERDVSGREHPIGNRKMVCRSF